MKHTLSKIALAIMLIHGSVSVQISHSSDDLVNANDDFFDEGDSFTLVEHLQRETWHWGVTSAHACTPNSQDNSGCINEDDTIEHIPVTGNPIDYPDFDNGFDNPADPVNDNGSDGESGGGSSGGGSEPEGPSEQEECLDRVQDESNRCTDNARYNFRKEGQRCQQLASGNEVNYEDIEQCETENMRNYGHDIVACEERLEKDIQHCNNYYGA